MISHTFILNEIKHEVVLSAVRNHKRVKPPVDLAIDVYVAATSRRTHVSVASVFIIGDTVSLAGMYTVFAR